MTVDARIAPLAANRTDVLAALHAASAKTGADFDYLLATAMRESKLDAQAQSKASSAAGLFQFVEQTWLGLVKRYGERHGLSNYAHAIHETDTGRYSVAAQATKSAILALRKDPQLSALMAGESANETRQSLQCSLGRDVCGGELYAAHFLGEGGARRLIALNEKNPHAAADAAFPLAARSNRSAFYHADGTAKTVGELYDWIVDLPTIPGAVPAVGVTQPAMMADLRGATQIAKSDGIFASQTSEPDSIELRGTAKTAGNFTMRVAPSVSDWTSKPTGAVTLPQSPLLLSPGVVEILASLTPLGKRNS